MKLGVFLQAQWDPREPGFDLEASIASLVRQAELADELGFESAWVPQHYVSAPYASIQPLPLLGLLAARTRRIRLGTGVYLLPFTRPVVLAEEIASLDWISSGRLIFGAGMGYRADEFAAMGIPQHERVRRFVEGLELIRKLWTEDSVSFDGTHFNLDSVSVSLKPKQAGGPPIWIGASVPGAVRRAAKIGDVWVSSMNPTFEELRSLFAEFDQARVGRPPAPERPTMRECYIGKPADVRSLLFAKYSAYQAWGVTSSNAPAADASSFDQTMQDKFLVGDVASVADRMRWLRDELGIDHLIVRVRWPGLREHQAFETMRELARLRHEL